MPHRRLRGRVGKRERAAGAPARAGGFRRMAYHPPMKARSFVAVLALLVGVAEVTLALTYRIRGWTWGDPWIAPVAGSLGIWISLLFLLVAGRETRVPGRGLKGGGSPHS